MSTAYEEKLEAFLEQLNDPELGYSDGLTFNGKPLPCMGPPREFFRTIKPTNFQEEAPEVRFQILRSDFLVNKIKNQDRIESNGHKFQVFRIAEDIQDPSVTLICNLLQ